MPTSRQHLIRVIALGAILSLSVGAVVATPPGAAAASEPAGRAESTMVSVPNSLLPAADLTQFRPGNLISNGTFYDSATMSAAQVQSFLESKVPNCQSGYTCVKDWTDTSRTVAADAMCGAYAGVANERASQIIYKVAQTCGINPRVLLVMLQKEQGLVTHTWPSDWRYTIAMGQGCPDTAACDTRYYGFFNQVYGAAWQLKRYSNPPGTTAYFTWYAPGKTWNVRYHPDAACGSSPVHIENQATANLYYYTPYQPNAAALRAGYGEGDGCSAYGNRNFYNYFTDWFGSTQTSGGAALVRTASNASVFLVSGSFRWHVSDPDDYAELATAFGHAAVVSDAFLAAFTLRGTTGAVLHNPETGVMSLVQGGALHRIPTCERAAMWGASCGAPTTVAPVMLAKLAAGPDVGDYFRLRGATTWGRFDSAVAVTPLYNEAAARAVNGDMRTTPFAPFLPTARYHSLTKSSLAFAPGQLVRSSSEERVYMTADFDRLLAVEAWEDVADFNRTPGDVVTVAPADLARYHPDGVVQPTLRCPSGTYLLASGIIHRLGDPDRAGLPTVSAAEITCAQFPLGNAVPGTVALRSADTETVFVVEQSLRRRAATWDHLVESSGGSAPVIVVVKHTTLQKIDYGAPLADGLLVKATGPALALVSGSNSHWLESFDLAREIGVPSTHLAVTDAEVSALSVGDKLALWVDCGSKTGFAAGGRVYSVAASAAEGFSPVGLSAATCGRLDVDMNVLTKVLVKSSESPSVFVAEGGSYRLVGTWAEAVGLSDGTPKVLVVSASTLASLLLGSG